ncbi:hypothetical protein [Paenarthrobacter aurescens]|uniref:Uncharacterized protein n=1 Tax=Paenarthrobacter aurescens (strain TC1) TaxID=290340 RepID=A1R3Z7_PAEAT|nr:hypothetical protein [Paenarthrobacter aurescens]ABM07512.1 hypothetical protein AAur_1173 [Paenarthrobacter aurescens TC1]
MVRDAHPRHAAVVRVTLGQGPAQQFDVERLHLDFRADLGELIGAVAACVTLIFVVRATRHSGQAVTEAQRMLVLEGDRDERAVALEERRQASQVAFWPPRLEGKSGNETLVPEIRATAKILPGPLRL